MSTKFNFDDNTADDDSIVDIHGRSSDSNRNYQLMPHSIAYMGDIYRLQSGMVTSKNSAFVKAQYISYRNRTPVHFNPELQFQAEKRYKKPLFLLSNFLMKPGKTSFWHVAHLVDRYKQQIVADILVLLVYVSRETRRPSPLSAMVKGRCEKSKQSYSARHDAQFLNEKQKLVSSQMASLQEMRNAKQLHGNNYIFRMRFELRWSDEDPNKHLNHAQCVAVIEDACISWRPSLRDKIDCHLDAITVLYWEEIAISKYACCYPTIYC